jgi:hypothetical protein
LSTDFKITLPYVIKNVLEMRLSDMELPATFYPFQDEYENNYFWMKLETVVDSITTVYYIYVYVPSGNYYPENLIDDIQTALTDANIPITITYNLSFENSGGIGNGDAKLTFSAESTDTAEVTNFELNFTGQKLPETESYYNSTHIFTESDSKVSYYNTESNIDYMQRFGWKLGFRKKYYSGQSTYTTEGQFEVIGPKYIYILLEDYNKSSNVNFFSNNETSELKGIIIGRISVKAYAFTLQSQNDYSTYSEPRYYYGPVNIHKLHIKLIDEYNRTVLLNGMDFSLTLQMIVKYDISNSGS